jgi:hypothetical protein
VGWNEPFIIAVIKAPIPGCAGVAVVAESEVLAVAGAGGVVTRLVRGLADATSAAEALVSAAVEGELAAGRLHVTHPTNGSKSAASESAVPEAPLAETGAVGVFATNEANRFPVPVVRPDKVCRALSDCTGT